MNVEVNDELCIGCGQCVETCPEVFEMVGDVAMAMNPERAGDCDVAEAAEMCPVQAITID